MKLYVSLCLQVVLVGVLWGAVSQEPDPEVFIDKYNLCNQKLQTISYDLENTVTVQLKSEKIFYTLEHCSSNENKQWIGRVKYYNEDGTLDPGNNYLVVNTSDEKRWVHLLSYSPEVENKRPPRASLWRSLRDEILQQNCELPDYGGPLTGQLYGSNYHSIYDLLKGATNLKFQNKVTKIIGYDTYLIEADTKYGIVRAWISPDVDYNCLKWEIIKDQNQFFRDGTTTDDRFTKWSAFYDAEKVEQIDGQHVVTQAKFNRKVKDGDKLLVNNTYHYNLKNIDLNPDYEALGAFKIQLPEGTVVYDKDFPGVKYQWIGGRLQPLIDDEVLNAIDANVDDLLKNKDTVPEKQVEKSQGDGAVKRAAQVDSKQLSDRDIGTIENEEKNGFWAKTKKKVFYIISAFLILVMAFFVYRYRRKAGNNEK